MTLEKMIENLIQVELDKHDQMSSYWFSIVEIGALKRDIKVAVQSVADKIREMKGIVTLDDDDNEEDVLIEKKEVLGLLVEGEK